MSGKGQGTSFEAGDLRRRIAIQSYTDTANGSGGFTRSWATISGLSSVPARIVYSPPAKKGDEVVTQQQVRSSVFATITVRYRPSLNLAANMRIVYGTRTFEIRTVVPVDEYRQEVTLQCEELQAAGSQH